MLRILLGVPIGAAPLAAAQADERTAQVLAAFEKICGARPDSIEAVDKLAAANGFTLERTAGAQTQAPAAGVNREAAWRFNGAGGAIQLEANIKGEAASYDLACEVFGRDVLDDEMLTGLKSFFNVGEPWRDGGAKAKVAGLWRRFPGEPVSTGAHMLYRPDNAARQIAGLSWFQHIAKQWRQRRQNVEARRCIGLRRVRASVPVVRPAASGNDARAA